ncbi:hypothetical protein IX51_06605 [uncultured archaeon]|nr:hypothetical protein IX51_06605 [uncultured archaeon]
MDRQIKVVIIILVVNFSIMPFVSNYYAYYLPQTHSFVLQEQGISNETLWGVHLYKYQNGVQQLMGTYESFSPTLSVDLPYGYYHYAPITPPGYISGVSGSDFHLSSSNVAPQMTLTFLKLYTLYFNESGLPGGSKWSVALNSPAGIVTSQSGNSTIEFSEPAGIYGYSVSQTSPTRGSVPKYPELPSTVYKNGFSSVVLRPSSSTVHVDFTSTAYSVTINISADFQVNTGNINGIGLQVDGRTVYSQFNFSGLSYNPIDLVLPNGTYQYSTHNVTGYSITNGWGFIQVNGQAANRTIFYRYHTQNLG